MEQQVPLQEVPHGHLPFTPAVPIWYPAESVFPLGRGIALTDALLFLNEEWTVILMQDTTI